MARLLRDESLVASWQSFFEENYKSEIETIALGYPEKRSLFVDYWDLDKADPKLTEILTNQPYKAVFNAEEALKNIDVSAEHKLQLHFRVRNLPETHKIVIRKMKTPKPTSFLLFCCSTKFEFTTELTSACQC